MNVLIDDDKLIHLGWEHKAKKAGVELRCFYSVDEFLGVYKEFDLDTDIYIDSDLKQKEKGEIGARRIFELGFRNLYLVTGYSDLNKDDFPWLKGVLSKGSPF
jgi:hypothetical protein